MAQILPFASASALNIRPSLSTTSEPNSLRFDRRWSRPANFFLRQDSLVLVNLIQRVVLSRPDVIPAVASLLANLLNHEAPVA